MPKSFQLLRKIVPLLVAALLSLSSVAQSKTGYISIDVKDVPVKEVLDKIERQTDFRFSYKESSLTGCGNVTLNCDKLPLQSVLNQLLQDTPLTYRIVSSKSIIIIEKNSNEKEATNVTGSKAKTIKGVVTDEDGEPLVGATVRLENNPSVVTVTNLDGVFQLTNIDEGDELTISYVGFETSRFAIGNSDTYNVIMEQISNSLDEVVVVGFGVQKRANLTGAVSSIAAKDLANRPVASAADALQGLAPGLEVLSSNLGGQLNGTRSMNIRGTGTIGSG